MEQGTADRSRRAIAVSGVVQGVGFRPFVFGLASRLGLRGFVRNGMGGVHIEVEGTACALDEFVAALESRPPPLARIDRLSWTPQPSRGDAAFRIEGSEAGGEGTVVVSPDVATCADCLRELFDPRDRRFRYPFLNCTNCGPRFTIVRSAPYDRERTTMAPFAMCPDCRREYDDPRDRRFHAQPVACPACGPRLIALGGRGEPVGTEDPLGWTVGLLREGKVFALKGIGGWHLACDARDEAAVAELRRRKHREEKPFALMVRDLAAVESLCEVSAEERALLASPARPIALLRRRAGARVAEAVAPDNPLLGVMLPYTPLQHLLLRELDQPLVMTSANRSDEPIAYQDGDALGRLSGIADFFLGSDREIHLRCDDSVLRVVGEVPVQFRRSRGYAPSPLRMEPPLAVPTLALGGELKSTFALGEGRTAFLSHHLGDLEHAEAFRAFAHAALHYQRLYRIEPRRLVHDLHPDYASTRYAQEQALREGLSLVAVQHHHAHLAACLAENGEQGEAIGVCFDGSGYGEDGTLWGGEFLVGGAARAIRAAHLLPVPLPGGEQAAREPWRMALAHLRAAGRPLGDLEVARRVPPEAVRAVERMLERGFNSPLTSSMGRLFDAVAAIAFASTRVSYEGQAAIRLEALAASAAADGSYPFELCGQAPLRVDPRPAVLAAAADARRGASAAAIARRFHSGVVEMVAQVCGRLRAATGLRTAALSGGVFLNAILTAEAEVRLAADGFRVLRHRLVPPNDGGLSLGQLAVVAARDARDREE